MANVRIQVEFEENRVKELDDLMKVCGLSTRKELLNNALSLFEWAVRQVSTGRIIASVDEADQKYRELQMPALSTAAKHEPVASKRPAAANW